MADDVNITPGSGVTIATDDIGGGRQAQLIKPVFGLDGIGTMVSDADPLPTITRFARPAAALLSSAAINEATSGDRTVLAGTALQTVRLFRMWLHVAAACSLKWKDGAGIDFHPAIPFTAGGTWVLDFDGEPWFVTTAGNGLLLNLSAAVQVSGRFYYTKS